MILILNNKISKDDKLSYINKIKNALKKLNIPYISVSKIKNIDLSKIIGIIITGSSIKLSKESQQGNFYRYVFNIYYLKKLNVPVIGICFGCQLLNIIYGGTLVDNKKYICKNIVFDDHNKRHILYKNMNTTTLGYCFSDIVIPNNKLNIKKFSSIRYNNKIIDVAFEYEKNKIFGVLFHPELNDNTHIIFKNFYDICKNKNY
jgi:GMP synthase (glutamine-hydrolysing)